MQTCVTVFSSKRKWKCRIECSATDLLDSVMQPSPKALWDAFRTCTEKNNGGCISRKDKSISLIPNSPRLGGISKGTCRSSIVCKDLSHRWVERRKGGGPTVSICASLDSVVMVRGRRGLPRCVFQSKMINVALYLH